MEDFRVTTFKFLKDRFVLITPYDVRTSVDGYNWSIEQRESPVFYDEYIAYGNGIFLRIHSNGNIYSSTDGLTWLLELDRDASPFRSGTIGLVFYENMFLTTDDGDLWGSLNGKHWTLISEDLQSHHVQDIIIGNDVLLIATDSGPFTWQNELDAGPLLSIVGPPPGSWVSSGTPYVFNIQTLPRAHPITSISLNLNGTKLLEISQAQTSFSITPTRVGNQEFELVAVDSNGNQSKQSVPLTVAGNLVEASSSDQIAPSDIVYFKGAFYGAGPGGVIYLSIDGANWERIQTPTSQNLTRLFANNFGIIAITRNEELLVSENGIHWIWMKDIKVDREFHTQPEDFFVFESSDRVIYSTDGYSWLSAESGELLAGYTKPKPTNLKPQFFGAGSEFYKGAPGHPITRVEWINNSRFGPATSFKDRLVTFNSNSDVVATTNGKDWQVVVPSDIDTHARKILSAGDTLFLLEQAPPNQSPFPTYSNPQPKIASVSFDGVEWLPSDGPEVIGNITFSNSSYFCANLQTFYESTNGIEWIEKGPSAYPDNSFIDQWKFLTSPTSFLSLAKRNGVDSEATLMASPG